ncbi:uncharacterized protein [Coffea arabica]|uniref:Uncharacterized protein n=1 Tax=Coffea arabica TaxID=13443 RepID=A0ABM4W610_COFAR
MVRDASQREWLLSAIYALPDRGLCRELWKYLKLVGSRINYPWLIIGDLNEIVEADEKMADNCELIDFGFNGPPLTWNNLWEGGARVRKHLDRALCNEDWRLQFPEAAVTHLAPAHSDQHPLLLEDAIRGRKPAGPKPFRFKLA